MAAAQAHPAGNGKVGERNGERDRSDYAVDWRSKRLAFCRLQRSTAHKSLLWQYRDRMVLVLSTATYVIYMLVYTDVYDYVGGVTWG